jgi:hypothetical protein
LEINQPKIHNIPMISLWCIWNRADFWVCWNHKYNYCSYYFHDIIPLDIHVGNISMSCHCWYCNIYIIIIS